MKTLSRMKFWILALTLTALFYSTLASGLVKWWNFQPISHTEAWVLMVFSSILAVIVGMFLGTLKKRSTWDGGNDEYN